MSYHYENSKDLNSNEGLIYIAFVGNYELYREMITNFMNHEGYGFVYVDSLEEVDKFSRGEVDAIVMPAEMECEALPKSSADIIRVTKNKDLAMDDVFLISDEKTAQTRNITFINEDGEKKSQRNEMSHTETAMDYITAHALYRRRKKLLKDFQNTIQTIISPEGTLDEDKLLKLFEAKDKTVLGHVKSVASLVTQMGFGLRTLGINISDEELDKARKVGLVHDLGKLYTPDQLLKNTDDFYPGEYLEMQRHADICYDFSVSEEVNQLIELAKMHHYRYDGKGYSGKENDDNNQQMLGNDIPLIAKMMITLDAFDAITDISRGYQVQAANSISPLENSIDILLRNSGTQFDPVCTQAFLIGFREAFIKDENFRNEWMMRERAYHDERSKHLTKHHNLGSIESFNPEKHQYDIIDKLDNTIQAFENMQNSNTSNKNL